MRALPFVVGLATLPAPAHATGADDLVALFADARTGTSPVSQAIDALGQARGWSRDPERSGEQGRTASQSINSSAWIVRSGKTLGGSPDLEVSTATITDRPDASRQSGETCGVIQRGFRSDAVAERLQAALHLAAPTRRTPDADGQTTRWTLSTDPPDAIVLMESRVRAGPVTTITRARSSTQEKR